ncbi:MAG TPA: FAD-binding protein [Myxococcales bacterium]|nr:FAD-binding protein [Myxococcales bacterium]
MSQSGADVLIVGAGPTGLTAGSELIRHGFSVRVIDSKPSPSRLSKALVLHARTMEVFESMGMVDRVLDTG